MSDARWIEIEAAVAAAVRHFSGAVEIFARLPAVEQESDKYSFEMGFMHAMQSGQTSMEAALLRILDLCGEEAPTGPRWHADLMARVSRAVGARPAIFGAEAAKAANETRQFRSIAAHAYDSFDRMRALPAVESAGVLAALLPAEIERFRQTIDP
nr:hypothetical protein [uncultured Rhodopila sp.]